eukprot:8935506-Pyramimonas_sp.AAC.1
MGLSQLLTYDEHDGWVRAYRFTQQLAARRSWELASTPTGSCQEVPSQPPLDLPGTGGAGPLRNAWPFRHAEEQGQIHWGVSFDVLLASKHSSPGTR